LPLFSVIAALERCQRRAAHDRDVVAGEVVGAQQLADLHLDQLQQLLVVDLVGLVHVDDQRRNADLAGQQDVLAGLRHRPVGGRHDDDGAVHLGSTGDHVLDVVGMPRAVDMGIMPVGRLVLDMRRRDRDAAGLLFGRLVDHVIGGEGRPAGLRQHLGDRRRQRRLAVIDMADRADVAMRLVPVEFRLGHFSSLRN
jgi:hypothetical protein